MLQRTSWLIVVPLLATLWVVGAEDESFRPRIAAASSEGELAIKKFRTPPGCQVELFAAEPLLANPVAFTVDEQGRFYVAETFRLHDGVTDIRGHVDWLDQDLACRTVQDRIAMMRQRLGKDAERSARAHDRVRLVQDRSGDGKADHATVFADGFRNLEDGIGAGVLARRGFVWYTCIPHLWLLRDSTGDGQADQRHALLQGFGVHVGFIGHDLHGLRMGPDGRIYFSIGDRGAHVVSGDKTLAYPDTGAVYRCWPDGSDFEVFCTGLRNPQELVFDHHGNLFTYDNNSDGGDRARWAYLVEGGDSGWRIGYQFINEPNARGPWNHERMWHPPNSDQPAFLTPPISNVGDGPSGLAYHPGVSQLPEKYVDHFFLADFRGGSANSGIRSFTNQPRGASFELIDSEEFLWSVLATDVDFAPDGALYLTDWVDGWGMPGKGRIYKVFDPGRADDARVREVKRLIAEGFLHRPVEELAGLLDHPDARIRQEAQFALVDKCLGWRLPGVEVPPTATFDEVEGVLVRVAKQGATRLGRLHAIWGIGQLARKRPSILAALSPLLADGDDEVKCQAAKVLSDGRWADSLPGLLDLTRHGNARVRFFATKALGKLGCKEAWPAVLEVARVNQDGDAFLRHACVMAAVALGDDARLAEAARDPSPAVRMTSLLAMRRRESDAISRFLADGDQRLVIEAARAINDVPIVGGLPALAGLAAYGKLPDALAYRVINANFRLGLEGNAAAVAKMATRSDLSPAARLEAVRMLGQWTRPSGRDRVTGLWRPLDPRPPEIAQAALRAHLAGILTGPERVRQEGIRLAGRLGIQEVGPMLLEILRDEKQAVASRREALRALDALRDQRLADGMNLALAAGDPQLRAEARRVLARLRPADALAEVRKALDHGEVVEKQGALALLGSLPSGEADQLLVEWLDRLLANQVPDELILELLEAARTRKIAASSDRLARYEKTRWAGPMGQYREALAGGDAERGGQLFRERADLSCIRCHKAKGEGGDVGPDLTGIGGKQNRQYLLEALVDPNKEIAKGYEGVVLLLHDGKIVAGVLRREDERALHVVTPEGHEVVVARDDVDQRKAGKSAMPEDVVKNVTMSELRDLVEFLANLR